MKEKVIKMIRDLVPELYEGPKEFTGYDRKTSVVECYKPIHLETILRAIERRYGADRFGTVATNGWFHFGADRCHYNVYVDFLEQDPSVYDFLYGVLI